MNAVDLLDAESFLEFFEANLERLDLARREVVACRAVPLKMSKTGGKSVVEYRLLLEPEGGGQPAAVNFVGVWRPDGEGAAVFDLMQDLRRRGFDGRAREAVVRPVAYFGECQLMILAKVQGLELERILKAGARGAAAPVEAAARWLAKLHATPVGSPRTRTFAQERALLDGWTRDLGRVFPAFGERLQGTATSLLQAEGSVRRDRFRLVHGDFHPENIFVEGDRVTVTDFERSGLFDPAADLGFFLCQLTAKAQTGRYPLGESDVRRLRGRFVDAYMRGAAEDLASRVPLYEARSFLEVAHYLYCGLRVPADPARFEFLMESAEGCAGSVA